MNKRKVKKKFELTCKEFRVMTMNDPNIFKGISIFEHPCYASNALGYRVCFINGKRVTPKEYYNFLDEKSKKYDNIRKSRCSYAKASI